jgi:hypothetical protein
VVKNGTITQFANGILGPFGHSRFTNLTARANTLFAVSIGDNGDPTDDVDANVIAGNRFDGNACAGAVIVFGSHDAVITRNRVTNMPKASTSRATRPSSATSPAATRRSAHPPSPGADRPAASRTAAGHGLIRVSRDVPAASRVRSA